MTIAPVWHPENGTLVYLAHDSLPPITLDHGQAYYAHTSGTRLGCYPLAPARQEGDDSVVYWSDGQRSRAVKAAKWAITLEPAGPGLARLLAERDALAVEDAGRGQQIAALQQRLADAQGAAQSSATLQASLNAANANVAALTQQVRDLEAKLAASPVTLDGAVHSQVAALVVAIGQMDAVVRAVAGALSVPVLAQTLPQLVAAMDRLDALAGALQARMAASGPESLVGPSDAAPVPATDLHSQAA